MSQDKTIVSVQYAKRGQPEFAGREYHYYAAIPLKVGDIVDAPVSGNIPVSVARVCKVDVSESKVDERILPHLKTIEKLNESEVNE